MTRRQPWFFAILVVVLLIFIFFIPSIGMKLRGLIGPQAAAPSDASRLAAENVSLKARLAELETIANELPSSTANAIPAMVYSGYPFNFKNELTVNVGSADGAATGDAALFEGNFVGVVTQVAAHRAVVQTVFDPNFKLPVRIGNNGYDALLVGGPYPAVQSIAKNATVAAGDVIYTAASGIPYAVPVGEIADVAVAANNLFQEASVSFAYDMGAVRAITIVKQQ